MMLGRLFAALFDLGVVVVTTSNTAPDDLYQGGLQRERFLPFIDLLKERLDILELDGVIDYRRERIKDMTIYHQPLGAAAEAALAAAFAQLTDGAAGGADDARRAGASAGGAAGSEGRRAIPTSTTCARTRSAPPTTSRSPPISTPSSSPSMPLMTPDQRNEARRFMTLIDALYEHKTNLICAAADAPDKLYVAGDGAREFKRTASRLIEMQSLAYLARPHLT